MNGLRGIDPHAEGHLAARTCLSWARMVPTPDVEDRQNMHPPRLSRQHSRTARAYGNGWEFAALGIRAPEGLLVGIHASSLACCSGFAPGMRMPRSTVDTGLPSPGPCVTDSWRRTRADGAASGSCRMSDAGWASRAMRRRLRNQLIMSDSILLPIFPTKDTSLLELAFRKLPDVPGAPLQIHSTQARGNYIGISPPIYAHPTSPSYTTRYFVTPISSAQG
jgi:hypothetical protein